MSKANIPNGYTIIQELPEDEKFNGENYVSWEDRIWRLGELKGLQLYWLGQITIPTPPTVGNDPDETPINSRVPNSYEYEIRKSVAMNTLLQNIKNPSALGFDSKGKTAAELWSWMKDEHEKISALTRRGKEEKLRSLKYEDVGGPVTGDGSYSEKWKVLWKKAKDAGVVMDEEQAVIVFVDSFPNTLEWTPCTGRLLKEKKLNAAAAELQEHYRLLTKDKSSATASSPPIQPSALDEYKVAAMNARILQLEAFIANNISQPQHGLNIPRNPDLVCVNCKSLGRTNFRGHTADKCWNPGGGQAGKWPSGFRKPGGSGNSEGNGNGHSQHTAHHAAITQYFAM